MSVQVDVIVVTGPAHCGKTSFLKSLCPEALITPAANAPSLVALPVSAESTLVFFELHGATWLDMPTFFHTSAHLRGILTLVDSTRPETFPEAKTIIAVHQQDSPHVPRLAVATHQDALDAWTIDELHMVLKIAQGDIVPCGAVQHESVKAVVQALLNRMPPDERVEQAMERIAAL